MMYYITCMLRADVAQSVERVLGKDEVTGSNPVISSSGNHRLYPVVFVYPAQN